MKKDKTKYKIPRYIPMYANGGDFWNKAGTFGREKGLTAALTGPIGLIADKMSDGKFSNWMNEHGKIIGGVAGGAAGLAIGNPMLGAQIGSQLGGIAQQAEAQDDQSIIDQENINKLNGQAVAQQRLMNQSQQMQFKNGGNLNSKNKKSGYIPMYPEGGTVKVQSNTYNPNVTSTTEQIPGGYNAYQEALKTLKESQGILTPQLAKKYPDFQNMYDKVISTGADTRYNTLQEASKKNYYLTPEEQQKYLGNNYQKYTSAQSQILKHMNAQIPGMYNVAGNEENVGDINNYGIRSAALTQYTGPQKTVEQMQAETKALAGQQGYTKYAKGGQLKGTQYNKDITYYPNGNTHENSKYGGIPIGNKGRVEQGEVRWKNYIFSDRLGK